MARILVLAVALTITAAGYAVLRDGVSAESVADELAKRSGFDSARCKKTDTDGYTCDIFDEGKRLLRKCGATEEGHAGGCIRVDPEISVAGEVWDEVERAFAGVGFQMGIAPTASEEQGWESSLWLISDRGAAYRGVPFGMLVFIFRTPERAAVYRRDIDGLVRLVYGWAKTDDFARRLTRRGEVLQRGRVFVFIKEPYPARWADRTREALALFPGQS